MKRASAIPSKTAVAGGAGAGLGAALLTAWTAFNPESLTSAQTAAVGTLVAIVTAFAVAWLTPDDSVSFGRRTKEALLGVLTNEADDHAAGIVPAEELNDTDTAPEVNPPE